MSSFPEDKVITISVDILTRYKNYPKVINLYDNGALKDLDTLIDFLVKLTESEFDENGVWNG